MAYTFIAAKKGRVGKSLVEDNKIKAALGIIKEAKETVKEKFDIELDLEVKLLGFNAEEINELWIIIW